jgi:hypothetical protein
VGRGVNSVSVARSTVTAHSAIVNLHVHNQSSVLQYLLAPLYVKPTIRGAISHAA